MSSGASTPPATRPPGVYYGEAVISGTNSDDGGGFEADIRMYDMDRVEVLRGPQGTLYGASSMSGTIRFIPKAPDLNNLGGYLTLEGSETAQASGNYNFNGAANLPIVDGVLGLRLVGWRLYDSGYINQIRVGEGVTQTVNVSTTSVPDYKTEPVQALGYLKGVNDDDVGGGRAILRFEPMDKLIIDLDYTTQTETSDGSSRYTPAGTTAFNDGVGGNIPPVQGCDLCNTDLTQSPWNDNLTIFGATINYDTGVGTVTGTANEYNRHTGFSFDSTPILVSYAVPVPAETFEPRNREVTSSELRYASAFDSPVNFVAGVYREHDHQFLDGRRDHHQRLRPADRPVLRQQQLRCADLSRLGYHVLRAHGRALDDAVCGLRRGDLEDHRRLERRRRHTLLHRVPLRACRCRPIRSAAFRPDPRWYRCLTRTRPSTRSPGRPT